MTKEFNTIECKETLKPLKILVIDDEDGIIETLTSMFQDNLNIKAIECHSVEEAIKAINEHNPDILFCDHSLTGNRGNEGFEILDYTNERGKIEFYSTSSKAGLQYKEKNIEVIEKLEIPYKIESILSSQKKDEN